MNRVRYAFEEFKDLKSFDIIPYQDIIDRYNSIQMSTYNDSLEKSDKNTQPVNSTKEKFNPKLAWKKHPPLRFRYQSPNTGLSTLVKADTASMDMQGLGETWDHFAYFTIPYEFVNKFQTKVLENQIITPFRLFMKEAITQGLGPKEIMKLRNKYDKLYPDLYNHQDFRPKVPYWRYMLIVDQFISILYDGVVYPICYNNPSEILDRGTHRSLMMAGSYCDVPVLIWYPELGGKELKEEWKIKLQPGFSDKNLYMIPDYKNKILRFYDDGEELEYTNNNLI